ncbi:polysaccharide deacetylase [Grosmannia clavigera kw1407]|uniref:chitin deacetylase n=1 Tax=Grosmannia clavigera (strain kw1407 / UAMH 11150) TaxID=655863 RepID=F0XR58_GROCL|nr:polysaccharide deacetylase [Grosmannia clavigera kw1407]EFW99815.1 polysaccharide deacetylase [Grosmannia clavigera kw1407]
MPRFPHILRLPSKLRRRARRQRMATLLALLAFCSLPLLLPLYVVYRPPGLLIAGFARRWPDVLWRVNLPSSPTTSPDGQPAPKLVALTIDDVPSEHTREILAILREHDAHATLFVIGGQVAGHEAVLREALAPASGHELANHGMHDEAARALADGELEAQILQVHQLLQNIYDHTSAATPPLYFRPGSGFFSDRMRALVRSLGYRLVLGSVYPHDAQIAHPWLNTHHILGMLRPGAIVICHDRRSWTPPMLRAMLPAAIQQGYRFVTVTELLAAAA